MLFNIWATQLLHLQQAALVLTASCRFHTLQEEEQWQQLIRVIIPQTMFSWTLFMAVMYLWIYEICCIRLQVFSRRLGSNEQTVHLLICFPVLYYSSYFIFKSKSNLIWLYSFCLSPEVIDVILLLEFSYLH